MAATAIHTPNQEATMAFFITVYGPKGQVVDTEQLPAAAFTEDEAYAFAQKIAAAHGHGHFARCLLDSLD